MNRFNRFTFVEVQAKVTRTDTQDTILYLNISDESGLAKLFASVPAMKIIVTSLSFPLSLQTEYPEDGVYEYSPVNKNVEPSVIAEINYQEPTNLMLGMVGKSLRQIEQIVIEETISNNGGSVPKAAKSLDVSPSTLYRKREAWRSE